MKRNIFIRVVALLICLVSVQSGNGQSPSFRTYMNPVIPGDHPDCTVSQIGDDYYTTGSSFNVTPTIYHSTDLVHWEAISQPVSASWSEYGDKPGGGCWGGHIVFYKGKYWQFFSTHPPMYFTTADKPEGPWSVPVKINDPAELSYGLGYDNSIFIDDNGKWYLVVKNGQPNGAIVELGDDGQPTGVVYDLNWLNVKISTNPDVYKYSWAEGPVMWKYNGYYYYSFARDLAGGQIVMRSKTLTAEEVAWEMLGDFFNESDPMKAGSKFTSPNHASNAVMLADSTSWVIHPLYAKDEWRGQGRQGLLNQVRYNSNDKPTADYPVNKYFTAPKLPSSGIPWMVPKSDFFTNEKLNPEWSQLGYTPEGKYSLTERKGWMKLSPKDTKMNTLTKNDGEHNYSLITKLDFEPKTTSDEAGILILRGDETMIVKLSSTVNNEGKKIINFNFNTKKYETENTIGNVLWLKIERVNHILSGFYSVNSVDWVQVGQTFDVSVIDSYSDFSSFTGTRQGIFTQNSNAFFDLYIYRDAYTPILAECPANQYGTLKTTLSQGIYLLDSIHNNDWALYAGVEFGNNEYTKACDSISLIASSATSGGSIEVWLDSIETGVKIATCNISNTGSWSTFKTFSAKTEKVQGRHDVYLRFIGNSSDLLFQLKWINFVPSLVTKYVSSKTSTDGKSLIVKFNKQLKSPLEPVGFCLLVNNSSQNEITGIASNPDDSLSVILSLKDTVKKDDILRLSYIPGNIVAVDDMKLVQFYDTLVFNSWYGSKPRITEIITDKGGDSLFVSFTKKMSAPGTGIEKMVLIKNGSVEVKVVSGELMDGDSTKYVLRLESKVYIEDALKLNYTGQAIKSFDDGVLSAFSSMPVINIAGGHPVELLSATLRKTGKKYFTIALKFDRPLLIGADQRSFFSVKINGKPATISNYNFALDSIRLLFSPNIVYGDIISFSYSGGNIQSMYNGKLSDITDFPVANIVPEETNIEANSLGKISVFPNPVKDRITVTSESEFNELKIYSILGVEVYSTKFNRTKSFTSPQLNITNGLYIVETKGNNSASMLKIFVQ